MKHANCGDTHVRWLARLAVISLAGGCSVTGTWTRVTTDPPNAPFPVDDLRLDSDGNYHAKWEYMGRKFGSYGTYEFRGGELIITQNGAMPRKYGAHLRLDGKLELTHMINEDSIRAVLKRQRQPKEEPAAREGQSDAPPNSSGATDKPADTGNGNAEP